MAYHEVLKDVGALVIFVASFGAMVFGFTFAVLLATCLSPWALACAGVMFVGVLGVRAVA